MQYNALEENPCSMPQADLWRDNNFWVLSRAAPLHSVVPQISCFGSFLSWKAPLFFELEGSCSRFAELPCCFWFLHLMPHGVPVMYGTVKFELLYWWLLGTAIRLANCPSWCARWTIEIDGSRNGQFMLSKRRALQDCSKTSTKLLANWTEMTRGNESFSLYSFCWTEEIISRTRYSAEKHVVWTYRINQTCPSRNMYYMISAATSGCLDTIH